MDSETKGAGSPALTPFSLSHSLQPSSTVSNQSLDYFTSRKDRAQSLFSPGTGTGTAGTTQSGSELAPAPIDGVPNEIIAHIFELAYLGEDLPNDALRTTISHVSSRLRRVARTTPSLWSKYHLTQGNVEAYLPHLPGFLEQSREYPLDIHLTCFWSHETTERLMPLLIPHSRKWRHLSITTPNVDIFSFLADVPVPALETLSLAHFSSQRRLELGCAVPFGGHLPSLKNLSLRNVSLDKVNLPLRHLTTLKIRGFGTWPDFATLDEMLSGSATLQELTLHVKPANVIHDLARQSEQPPIALPALRKFTVFTSEWLTEDVARLVRVFAMPNVESLVVREGSGVGYEEQPIDILRYDAAPVPTLRTTHADVAVACRCLTPELLEHLNTLELTKAVWKEHELLARVFRGMVSLERLVLVQLNPFTVMQDLGAGVSDESIRLSALRTLDVDMIKDFRPAEAGLAQFIRMFSMPRLSSLVLRHLSQVAWKTTVECFAAHKEEYLGLTSLTLVGKALEAAPCSPVVAFPRLKSLAMYGIPSNLLVARLMEDDGYGGVGWPHLESLTISGDKNASKPLLHRAIEKRKRAGRPIEKLYLDGSFRGNSESWEWIRGHVGEVMEAEVRML